MGLYFNHKLRTKKYPLPSGGTQGEFRCSIPRRLVHSVLVVLKYRHCFPRNTLRHALVTCRISTQFFTYINASVGYAVKHTRDPEDLEWLDTGQGACSPTELASSPYLALAQNTIRQRILGYCLLHTHGAYQDNLKSTRQNRERCRLSSVSHHKIVDPRSRLQRSDGTTAALLSGVPISLVFLVPLLSLLAIFPFCEPNTSLSVSLSLGARRSRSSARGRRLHADRCTASPHFWGHKGLMTVPPFPLSRRPRPRPSSPLLRH